MDFHSAVHYLDMSDFQGNKGPGRPNADQQVVLRLYVADKAPNSTLAIKNLKAICHEYLPDSYQLEIVDVLEEPLRAITDGILVTPTLIKVSPPPSIKVIGNLSERDKVLQMLEIGEE